GRNGRGCLSALPVKWTGSADHATEGSHHRAARLRQDHHRRRARRAARRRAARHRRRRRARGRQADRRDLHRRRRGALPRAGTRGRRGGAGRARGRRRARRRRDPGGGDAVAARRAHRRLPAGRAVGGDQAGGAGFGAAAAGTESAQPDAQAPGGAPAHLRAARHRLGRHRRPRARRDRRRDRQGAGGRRRRERGAVLPRGGGVTQSRVHVGGADPYDVVIGTGVMGELPAMVGDRARTVAVVHAEGLPEIARPVCGALESAGYAVHALPVPDGEAAKEVGVLAGLWSAFARAGMTRTDVVVGVGGGAATDLAGFAAASWLRGVRAVLVPTTLLGMVDAAVGGKTGINIPEGKNLVGAFHPPAGVVCDLATLPTMPREDYVSG